MDENDIVENVERAALLEVVKRITDIEDGDVLVVRYEDESAIDRFLEVFDEVVGKKVLFVHQDGLDILDELDEKAMSKAGWIKTEKAKEITQILSDRLRDGATVDVDILFEELGL